MFPPQVATASFSANPARRSGVFRYIETFYNHKRIHQALGYKTPDPFEAEKRHSFRPE